MSESDRLKSKVALSVLLLSLFASCSQSPSIEYLKGNTMGTVYTVQFWGSNNTDIQQLNTDIDSLLDRFENELSNWREDSWVNRFNAAPANESIPVPDYAFQVIELCLELAERSEGALDPTLSPLIELWGFGARRDETVPAPNAIRGALKQTGYQKLVLDRKNRTLRKTQAGLQLNCSAVAKGFAVDLVTLLLEENQFENFLVNIGGEVVAQGTQIDGAPWQVGISQPTPDGRQAKSETKIALSNQALATSGHSQRAFIFEGRRYSHILDPRTGYPVPTEIASSTVTAPTCALADGLATLALILEEKDMTKLLDHYSDSVLIRTPWRIQNSDK